MYLHFNANSTFIFESHTYAYVYQFTIINFALMVLSLNLFF